MDLFPKEGQLEKPQKPENCVTNHQFLESVKLKTSDLKTSDPEKNFPKFRRYQRVTVPHQKDLSLLMTDCKKFIDWIYSSGKKDHNLQFIPRSVEGNLEPHTLGGILFILGRKTRSKNPPAEPFAVFFGKFLTLYGTMSVVYEPLGLSLPAPDFAAIDGEFESIRWATVYADRVEFMIRVFAAKPFNISEMPNLGMSGDADEA